MKLFGRTKQPPIRSLVGEGTYVSGGLRFVDGLRIDGDVLGDVLADDEGASLLVISERARVRGKVKASHVIIAGEVHGPIQADELLELQPKARVTGDVSYQRLEMHQGAVVNGAMRSTQESKPTLKLAASNGGAPAGATPAGPQRTGAGGQGAGG